MESQESDICNPDDLQFLVDQSGMQNIIDAFPSWADVPVPSAESATGELPARNDWMGTHFFEAKVDLTGLHKRFYVVSTRLNKVFVDMEKVVPFQIKWDGHPGLFVRAMLMFASADQMKQPVKRCRTHMHEDDPSNQFYDFKEHVLATENENARYSVDPISQRHSVVVPLQQPQGCDYALVNLKFMCKTSCSGGINRSPTDLIFTLEDEQGLVLGRQKISVKICSCPKRDKEKEESTIIDPNGKRKTKIKKEEKAHSHRSLELEPPVKKIKQEINPLEGSYSTSFMVTAANQEIAERLKEHIRKWHDVMMVECSTPGVPPSPLISIADHLAVVQQPYM